MTVPASIRIQQAMHQISPEDLVVILIQYGTKLSPMSAETLTKLSLVAQRSLVATRTVPYSYEAGILKGGTEHVPYLYRQLLFPRSRHEISDMILNG